MSPSETQALIILRYVVAQKTHAYLFWLFCMIIASAYIININYFKIKMLLKKTFMHLM